MVNSLDGISIAVVTRDPTSRDWAEVMPTALFELSEMLRERFHHAGLDKLLMECRDGWALTLRTGQGALLTVVGKSGSPNGSRPT